jgi:hypothetical protein
MPTSAAVSFITVSSTVAIIRPMFEQILELNARAAAEGNYEAAYHLLMAALHCAERGGDSAALERLATLATLQGAAVEAVTPVHHLSRTHAEARGQTAIFDSYLAHVDAVRLRLESVRQRQKRRPG